MCMYLYTHMHFQIQPVESIQCHLYIWFQDDSSSLGNQLASSSLGKATSVPGFTQFQPLFFIKYYSLNGHFKTFYIFLLIMCMNALPACMHKAHVIHMCVWRPRKSDEGIRSPGSNSCEPPYRYWKLSPGPLQSSKCLNHRSVSQVPHVVLYYFSLCPTELLPSGDYGNNTSNVPCETWVPKTMSGLQSSQMKHSCHFNVDMLHDTRWTLSYIFLKVSM